MKESTSQGIAMGSYSTGVPSIIHEMLRSPGQPLDAETRAFMEPRFGHDFSRVRVHADTKATESAQSVKALAYTVGHDMVFGRGQYEPGTSEGRKLLGHELTHVVQQQAAPQDGHTQHATENTTNAIASLNYPTVQRACGPTAIGVVSGCSSMSGEVHASPLTSRPFLFEVNCDDFKPGEEAALIDFVKTTATSSADLMEIHGFASTDGPLNFNINLACARARKAKDVLTKENLYPPDSPPLINHGPMPGNAEQRRSVVIVIKQPAPPPSPASSFSHSAAAAYAKKWATGTNPAYMRFGDDCTNFVSQAMEAGGWTQITGSDRCALYKTDSVWWFKKDACSRLIRSNVHASFTWAGAHNFYRFLGTSGRGTLAKTVDDLEPGDVLQRDHGDGNMHHSMVVTGKGTEMIGGKNITQIKLSYHTKDTLDRKFYGPGGILDDTSAGWKYYAWKIG